MPYRIEPEETFPDSIRRIMREQVEKALAEIDDQAIDIHETVHQVRKRCKKVRGALRLARAALPRDYARENREYRDAARTLSAIRDAQSTLETFDALTDSFAQSLEEGAFSPIREMLVAHRRKTTAILSDTSDPIFDLRLQMKQSLLRIDTWEFAESSLDAVDGGLEKTYRRARKSFEKARRQPTTERIHEWRKRVKYHRFHLRLLRPIWNGPLGAREDEADSLSDLLGDDHDLSVLRETVLTGSGDIADPKTVQTLLGLINQRQTELRLRAKPIGARLFAEKAGTFVRRMRHYRDAWCAEAESVPRPTHRPELITA